MCPAPGRTLPRPSRSWKEVDMEKIVLTLLPMEKILLILLPERIDFSYF